MLGRVEKAAKPEEWRMGGCLPYRSDTHHWCQKVWDTCCQKWRTFAKWLRFAVDVMKAGLGFIVPVMRMTQPSKRR